MPQAVAALPVLFFPGLEQTHGGLPLGSIKPESLVPEQFQAGINDLGVIEDPAFFRDFPKGRIDAFCGSVRTVRGDRLHHIGNGQDPSAAADLRALQGGGVPEPSSRS